MRRIVSRFPVGASGIQSVLFRTKWSAIQPTKVKKPIIPIIAAIPDIFTSYLLFGLWFGFIYHCIA
jgi:hypothetical protein